MDLRRRAFCALAAFAFSGAAQAAETVLTADAEDGFQKIIARYKAEGLGAPGTTLEGFAIDGHRVTVSLRLEGRPLSWHLTSAEEVEAEGAGTWFTWTHVSGDETTAEAVEARRRLSAWLQTAFVINPWVLRQRSSPPPIASNSLAPMQARRSHPVPAWGVGSLATLTVLLGVGLAWRRRP